MRPSVRLSFDFPLPFEPMEALSVDQLPVGDHWQYEPKWDGFRTIAIKDGATVYLQSKAGQPLARYFPEIVAATKKLPVRRFVLDGEMVISDHEVLSFDRLLQRIHPAASRVLKLSVETPATYIVFDLLVDPGGRSYINDPLRKRRSALEAFAKRVITAASRLQLSPRTENLDDAKTWSKKLAGSLDGLIAKRLDARYEPGLRTGAVQKFKYWRSADCVVGGFRYAEKPWHGKKVVGSLLLGVYNDQGKLDHVGYTSSIHDNEKESVTKKLEKDRGGPGFTGKAPGGPSRWSTKRSAEWEPLKGSLVVEVEYDHFSEGRFRHGTTLLRWRPDKSPRQCLWGQLERAKRTPLSLIKTP